MDLDLAEHNILFNYKCMEFLIFYCDGYDPFHMTEDDVSELMNIFLIAAPLWLSSTECLSWPTVLCDIAQ